jgi:hypothetical protein
MKAHIEQDTLSPESAVDRVVLAAAGIVKSYRRGVWPVRRRVRVLTGADIFLHPGEVVGLVGENGSGKSTLMKVPPSRRLRVWWSAITGAIGTVVGLAPHVLHHVGLLAGTALVAGTGGTILFGALGLLASIPLLLRLRRRFHSWWAPLIGLAVFAAMFTLSAFVIGPAISGANDPPPSTPSDQQPSPSVDYDGHHT